MPHTTTQGEHFGLDNLTYDVLTVLHEKSKGLEAYEQYMEDASDDEELRELFEQIADEDQRHVAQLKMQLRKILDRTGAEEEEPEGAAADVEPDDID